MKTIIMLLTLTVAAFAQQKQAPKAKTEPPKQVTTAEDAPEDPPKFKRKYLVKLLSKPGITLSVECNDSSYGDRSCWATLRQADERSVLFNISGYSTPREAVAEHILDPVIVPEVRRLCEEIYIADVRYRKSNPTEFKTTDGEKWTKVK